MVHAAKRSKKLIHKREQEVFASRSLALSDDEERRRNEAVGVEPGTCKEEMGTDHTIQ